jgi:asparagine synthase (glutamine-hydrolysing)
MGAFFLYHHSAAVSLGEARQVFRRKGFSEPCQFTLGAWTLLSYGKMLVAADNFVRGHGGSSVHICGTVVYRGLGYRASLERLLADLLGKRLDQDELIGNFCLLFWDGHKLWLLTDRLNAQHLFANEARTCLSTSFLAVLAGSPVSLQLNSVALLEKLASGYIVSPDTLVEGIHQMDDHLLAALPRQADIEFIPHPPEVNSSELHGNGFQDSVRRQLATLRNFILRLKDLDGEYRAELGLSSGYDSRLLLSLSQCLARPIPLHSHHTRKVHESELAIARELAAIGGNELSVIPTTRLLDQSEERRKEVIADNLYFFDGRCIHDMGHGSETYTAQYRKRVLGTNRLSLHGLGGETYRNVYATPSGRFSWNEWTDYAIFFPFAREACGNPDTFRAMRQRRNEKIAGRLGTDLSESVDAHVTRRYYGLVRMPDCASNVSNAYNQVAFTLTPFIDPMTLREALKATPYIGCDGKYEAAMIRELAPRLASVSSQYGHSFSAIPALHRLKATVTASIPLRWRTARRQRLCAVGSHPVPGAGGGAVSGDLDCIGELEEVLRTVLPMSNWSLALCADSQKRTSLFVASFLREFEHKLRF